MRNGRMGNPPYIYIDLNTYHSFSSFVCGYNQAKTSLKQIRIWKIIFNFTRLTNNWQLIEDVKRKKIHELTWLITAMIRVTFNHFQPQYERFKWNYALFLRHVHFFFRPYGNSWWWWMPRPIRCLCSISKCIFLKKNIPEWLSEWKRISICIF